MRLQHKGLPVDRRNGRNVADEIEIELVVERRVEHVGQGDHEQRVAVRRCMHDGFGRDVAACPGPVVDDERLAESIRQLLTQQPRDDVGRAAGRKTDENAHRPRRIGLRPSDARDSRQRGSTRGQMQEFAAGKFHGLPLCNVGDATLYSALILAARITFAHLAVSDLMTTANSSGELRDTSRPSCAIRSRTSACTAICTMSACTLLTTAAGVPAGANSPNQEVASKSGKPDSASVGSSEMNGERLSDVTARPRSLPSRTSGRIAPMFISVMVTRPLITSVRTAPR